MVDDVLVLPEFSLTAVNRFNNKFLEESAAARGGGCEYVRIITGAICRHSAVMVASNYEKTHTHTHIRFVDSAVL